MKKSRIISIVCIILIISIVVTISIITINKNKEKQNANNNIEKNISDGIELNRVTFNELKIGDKIQEKMKNLVVDAPFKYIYEKIYINADKEDNINYLAFYESEDTQGNKIDNINDVSIKYNNNKLTNISDFKAIFGNGTKLDINGNKYYIKYYDGSTVLTLQIINDELYSVILNNK